MTIGDNREIYGTRTPLVNMVRGTTRMRICSSLNEKINHCYVMSQNLTSRAYTSVEISQAPREIDRDFQYEIKIKDETVYSKRNTKAQTFANVSLYISSPWKNAARVKIRKLSFTNYLP